MDPITSALKRHLSLLGSVGALVLLAAAAGCTGFFVDQPNSVSVTTASGGSSFTVASGSTVQLKATAAFDSGSKDVTNSANWSSSTSCATVNNAGLVTGVGSASNVTITASVSGVSGSVTGSVTGGSGQTISITPAGPFTNGTSSQFFATQSGSDVTASVTWASSNTSVVSFSTATNGLASFVGTGTATITASLASGNTCSSGSISVTVQ